MFDDLVAFWKRTSLLMDGLCRSRGIEYLHFLQPNQYVPGSKPLSSEEKRIAWKDDHPYKTVVEKAYPLLTAAGEELRREGVRFFDLTGIFEGVTEALYSDTCCHFNLRGNKIMAQAIGAAIDTAAAAR